MRRGKMADVIHPFPVEPPSLDIEHIMEEIRKKIHVSLALPPGHILMMSAPVRNRRQFEERCAVMMKDLNDGNK